MHIGHLIKEKFDLEPKGHTVKWFAEKLNCNVRNVYDIFSRSTIDTDLLLRISIILNYNFFEHLSESFKEKNNIAVFKEDKEVK